MGCGAGLLAEPLARLGARVTGIDAASENIAGARAHALGQGLEIDYRAGGAEALEGRYDLVTSLEVVEHVADPAAFVGALAAAVGENGLLIISTPNRTSWSKLVMIGIGEGTGRIPKGTHVFRFPPQRRLVAGHRLLHQANTQPGRPAGAVCHAGTRSARATVAFCLEAHVSPDAFSARRDRCDVRIGENTFRGNLHEYDIHFSHDGVTVDVKLTGQVPSWRPTSGHMYFGEHDEHFFAWLPAVPQGEVSVDLNIRGKKEHLQGRRLSRPQLG